MGGTGRQVLPSYPISSQEEAAVAALQPYEGQEILAWLAFAREGGFRHWDGRGRLSVQQVHAIKTLEKCKDTQVLAWLETTRLEGQESTAFYPKGTSANAII